MSYAKLEVEATIFCEDIRREDDGSQILLGVLITDFIVSSFPTQITMIVHNQGRVSEGGPVRFGLRIEDDAGGVLYDATNPENREFHVGRYAAAHQFIITAIRETPLRFIFRNGDDTYELPGRRVITGDTALRERSIDPSEVEAASNA